MIIRAANRLTGCETFPMADRGRAGNSNSAIKEIDADNSLTVSEHETSEVITLSRTEELTREAAASTGGPAAGPPAVQLTGLTKRYGDVVAVGGIDLTIPA